MRERAPPGLDAEAESAGLAFLQEMGVQDRVDHDHWLDVEMVDEGAGGCVAQVEPGEVVWGGRERAVPWAMD